MKPVIVAVAFLAVTANCQQPLPVARPHQGLSHCLVEGSHWLDGGDRIEMTEALSPRDRSALIDAISVLLRPGTKIGDPTSEKDLLDAAKQSRVKLIDLNGDGIPEVIAQPSGNGFCSPTGNCPIWVFMRSGRGYRIILQRNSIQTYRICATESGGFKDVVLRQHGSAFESDLFVYRFAKGKYRKGACYDANWESMVGDELRELKSPIITPCSR